MAATTTMTAAATAAAIAPGVAGRMCARAGAGPMAAAPLGARNGSVAGLGIAPLRQRMERVAAAPGLKRSLTIKAAKAEGQPDATELQAVLEDYLNKAKATWGKVDDKVAIAGLGIVGLVVLWGSFGLINAIDRLPLIPGLLEIVGLLYTGWFVYRYVLFKPDREELLKIVDETKSKITGQSDL